MSTLYKVPVTLVIDYHVKAESADDAVAKMKTNLERFADYKDVSCLSGTMNDIATEVGAPEPITRFFTVEFTVRYRVEDIEAEDEDDARDQVETEWTYLDKLERFADYDEIDFEIEEVEEQ